MGRCRKARSISNVVGAEAIATIDAQLGALLTIVVSNVYANLASGDVIISPFAILFGLGGSTIGSVAAGLYPAHRSARLDPVKALQSE